jgi:hypothetical protein
MPKRTMTLIELIRGLQSYGYMRVAKLVGRQANFIIIGEHEPYYLKAYGMIRQQEKGQNTWTDDDEQMWVEAIERKAKAAGLL